MAVSLSALIGPAAAAAVVWYFWCLCRNVLKARKTGFVYIVLRKCAALPFEPNISRVPSPRTGS